MNILIMGLGYVGLTAALGFAEKGHKVFAYDSNPEKLKTLIEKTDSLFEPGLSEAFACHYGNNLIVFPGPPPDISEVDAVFICVSTPCDDDGRCDLRNIYAAIDTLKLKSGEFSGIIVIKSTVPPDTAKTKIIPYLQNRGVTAPVASNPEFLREGCCWNDFITPDRIVCGVEDENTADVMKEIYKDFNAPIVLTTLNTAEFIKYLSNNMLSTMISFSNEMSKVANAIGDISIRQAFKALHMDKRWEKAPMKSYVYPGCGFGGECLPKDLQAMITHAKSYGVSPIMLQTAQDINNSMTDFFIKQITADVSENIGILGLSFKPYTDDVRFSPAAGIISALIEKGYQHIYAHDPAANGAFHESYAFPINYCDSIEELCQKAKTVIITTAWPQFRGLDKLFKDVCFVDGRYML